MTTHTGGMIDSVAATIVDIITDTAPSVVVGTAKEAPLIIQVLPETSSFLTTTTLYCYEVCVVHPITQSKTPSS